MSYQEFVKRVLTVVFIIVVLLGLWHLRNIVLMGFLATIVSVSLSIPVQRLRRHFNLSRGLAIALTVIGLILALGLLVTWILPTVVVQMAELGEDLPNAFDEAADAYDDWRRKNDVLASFLPAANSQEIRKALGFTGEDLSEPPISIADVTAFALPALGNVGSFLLGAIANILIIIIVSVFLLVDPMDYATGGLMLIPRSYQPRAVEVMMELRRTLVTWMTAQVLSITVTIVLVWLVLGMILGMPNALAVGVIAGLATFIPNIGSIIPLIPIVIFTLADDPGRLIFILPAYILIQQVESNVITPSFVKSELNIPAGTILLFQLMAAALFGFLGILLAVPLLAVLITLVKELYVYDCLGMRGEQVGLVELEDGSVQLVRSETAHAD
ncbi:MAG: AI-2E family transporter [Anaerolineae bacterium]|nr:AI-2E family transporter [Anaerolineae bacterium]